MARKVLGNDPFGGGDAPKADTTKKSAPAKKGPAAKGAPAKGATAKGATAKGATAKKAEVKPTRKPVPKASSLSPEPAAPAPQEAERDEAPELVAEDIVVEQPTVTHAATEAATTATEATDAEAAPPPPALETAPEAEAPPTIESLASQLDALLDQAMEPDAHRPLLGRLASKLRGLVQPEPERAIAPAPAPDSEPFDAARELHASDYYLRRWGQTAIRDRSEEVDDFGLDPDYARRWQPVWNLLYERWWRVEVEGIENVPAEGRVALVANHSGAIPFDGIMLATALRREHPTPRTLRWLAEDFIFHFPFAGAYLNRLGAVRACQENAERLLSKDACLALFPEGVKGIAKPFRERYQLQRFGRGGHIKLAIRTRTPIVPVTIVGAEETHPMLFPSGRIAKMLGVPFVPVTPTFPLLGPLGLAGLPARWKISFGEPISMDAYRPEQSEDIVLVNRLNEKLRETIQGSLDRLLRARQSVFRG